LGTVDHDADEVVGEGRIQRLPRRVQDTLGELAGAAKEGLMALSVGVGLGVLHELMEAEIVRHEALSDRAGCETSPLGCRSSLVKLGAVGAWNCG